MLPAASWVTLNLTPALFIFLTMHGLVVIARAVQRGHVVGVLLCGAFSSLVTAFRREEATEERQKEGRGSSPRTQGLVGGGLMRGGHFSPTDLHQLQPMDE